MYICPKCGSTRVFKLRIDSDWGGSADYFQVNDDDAYESDDLVLDVTDRPDVEVYHCLKCQAMWDCE